MHGYFANKHVDFVLLVSRILARSCPFLCSLKILSCSAVNLWPWPVRLKTMSLGLVLNFAIESLGLFLASLCVLCVALADIYHQNTTNLCAGFWQRLMFVMSFKCFVSVRCDLWARELPILIPRYWSYYVRCDSLNHCSVNPCLWPWHVYSWS